MRLVLSLILAASMAYGAACTSAGAGNWNNKATWGASGCAGASALCSDATSPCPGLGDTVTINHAVTQNVADLIVGKNNEAPVTSYLSSLGTAGGGTGYTSCTGAVTLSGGTARRAGAVSCYVDGGVLRIVVVDRGSYTVCPTSWTATASGGSGATLTGTPVCATAGGTAAVAVGNNGTLTIAANTYVRGTLTISGGYAVSTRGVVLNPGYGLYMDMTQAPAGALYRIEMIDYYRQFGGDCTGTTGFGPQSLNGCTFQGYGGVTSLESINASTAYPPGAVWKNIYFKNVGDANTIRSLATHNGGEMQFINNTFDACGPLVITNNTSATDQLTFSGNYHLNTPVKFAADKRPINLSVAHSAAKTTGIRIISGNVFDGVLWNLNPSSNNSLKDFTLSGNVFMKTLAGGILSTATWDSFTNNLWRLDPASAASGNLDIVAGSVSNSYMFLDVDNIANPHFWNNSASTAATHDGNVHGFSGRNTGDGGEWVILHASADVTVQNSVFLCDASGVGSSEIITPMGSTGTKTVTGNVYCGGYGGFGPVQLNETADSVAGSVTMRNTITWESASGSGTSLKMNTVRQPGTQDICTTSSATTSNCDYNAGYGTAATQAVCTGCTNQGRGYAGLWSYTPGAHDVDGVNPQLADPASKLENFDRRYLGKAVGTAWTGGGTYAFGDIVSNSDAQVYGGEVFNYRCINASGCTGLGGPGVYNTEWRANWEWASLYWIRDLTARATTYTDGAIGCSGCSVMQALVAWVKRGYLPQNPAFWCSGHDGETIGALPYCSQGKANLGALGVF